MTTKTKIIIVISVTLILGIILIIFGPSVKTSSFSAAFNAEFLTRPDGYSGLIKHYGFSFPDKPKQMDSGLMYRALADGAVDIVDGFSTDGRIPAYDLFILEDDKRFFPPYFAAPLIRRQCLRKYPMIKSILQKLAGSINNKKMQKLNYQVDEKGMKPEEAAREFLISSGLIDKNSKPGSASEGSIIIGSKEFTEQEILGQIIAILIEYNSDIKVIRKLNLGSTMICFTALKSGDIDLYPEYTGTGLVNIIKEKVISDPLKSYEKVKKEFRNRYNLMWLEPFGFNNTYTLTMRKKHAKKLGIKTITELADYLKKFQKLSN